MRRSAYRSLAAASLLLGMVHAHGAMRPRYGGMLRIEMQQAVRSLDPADWPAAHAEIAAKEKLAALVFEPLVRLDANGRAQPALAVSWERDASGRRWQFRLRTGVRFHDGSPLTPAAAAAAPALAGWQASPAGDGIAVRSDQPLELADFAGIRRSIFLRAPDGTLAGTGPFRIAQFEPGRRAVFNASEDYWGGRPFLEAIAVEMGRAPHEQMLDRELGKADLVELWPNELRRAAQAGWKIWSSSPVALLALVFERGRAAVEDARLREAVALSIDRAAIHGVLLQKQGEPAGGLLPQWLSGYAFLFPAARDPARARQLAAAAAPAAPLLLGYDPADPLARPLAERIAVNAREAGIRLQVVPQAGRADLRLARARIRGTDAAGALTRAVSALQAGELQLNAAAPEAAYAAERALIEEFRVVPLVHLPEIYGSSAAVKCWQTPGLLKTGEWRLDDLWLGPEHP